MRREQGRERTRARHNDVQAFDDAIRSWREGGGTGRPWIAVESLYSMDGDRAPLADLVAIADAPRRRARHRRGARDRRSGAPDGRGLGAALEGRPDVVSLHTCGKALGVMGALVLLPGADARLPRQPLPALHLCDRAVAADGGGRAREPRPRRAASPSGASVSPSSSPSPGASSQARCGLSPSGSQIQPVIVGGRTSRGGRARHGMQAQGFDIRAVRPPTVPEGTARLRISLTLNVDEADDRPHARRARPDACAGPRMKYLVPTHQRLPLTLTLSPGEREL